ncbi:MAG: hypothetical protein EXR45_05245 [Chloroflexi bacterium]|nr:hypothetical protein [Chloroflexota bacterium]
MTLRDLVARTQNRRSTACDATFGLVALLAACGAISDDDASRKAVEWFELELSRIGYSRIEDGLWAIPPRKVAVAVQGDALEAQIRAISPTGVRPTPIEANSQSSSITWRGQVYLKYLSRERFHRGGTPGTWSEWQDTSSVLNIERRSGQWYVQRVK